MAVEYKQPVKTRFPVVEDYEIMLKMISEELPCMELENQMCKGSKYQIPCIDELHVLSKVLYGTGHTSSVTVSWTFAEKFHLTT